MYRSLRGSAPEPSRLSCELKHAYSLHLPKSARNSVRSKVKLNPSLMVTMVTAYLDQVDNWHHIASFPDHAPDHVFFIVAYFSLHGKHLGWDGGGRWERGYRD